MDIITAEEILNDEIMPKRMKAVMIADMYEIVTSACLEMYTIEDFYYCLNLFKSFITFIEDNECILFDDFAEETHEAHVLILNEKKSIFNSKARGNKFLEEVLKKIISEKYLANKDYNDSTTKLIYIILTYYVRRLNIECIEENDLDLWEAQKLIAKFACVIKCIDSAKSKGILFLN